MIDKNSDEYPLGWLNSFTYPIIATLINNYLDRNKNLNENNIKVLELGFGSGANLLYLAKRGCSVYGIDISDTALEYGNKLFLDNNIKAELKISSFAPLDYEDNTFDLVIDRGALVCADKELYKEAVKEVYRILKPNGEFLLTPYSELNHGTIAINNINDDYVHSTSNVGGGKYNISHL